MKINAATKAAILKRGYDIEYALIGKYIYRTTTYDCGGTYYLEQAIAKHKDVADYRDHDFWTLAKVTSESEGYYAFIE